MFMIVFNIKGHALLHVLFLPFFRTLDVISWDGNDQACRYPALLVTAYLFIDAGNIVHDKWPIQGPKSLQSCMTLCDPMDCSPAGFSVCGILQARILEWLAISFSRGSSQPRDQTWVSFVSCTGRQVLYY